MSARHRGTQYYATLVAALMESSGIASDLAERTGFSIEHVRIVMRQLHAIGMVHVSDWHRKTRNGKNAGGLFGAVWSFGPGVDAIAPVGSRGQALTNLRPERPRIGTELLTFAEVWKLLSSGSFAIPTIADHIGADRCSMRRLIQRMRSLKLVYVADWDEEMNVAPTRLYTLGNKRDADRPKRISRAEWSRAYRERQIGIARSTALLHAIPRPFDLMASQLAGA